MSATDLRLALQANGYSPVPCVGKRPSIPRWQHKVTASADEMRSWPGPNTGVLTERTPTVDIDIVDPEAAALAEELP